MARKLTAVAVEKLKAGKTRREIPDGAASGLYLVVQPTGEKSWAMRFRRPDSKHAKLTLGALSSDLTDKETSAEPVIGGPLTIKAAHRLAAKINHQRALGIDVIAETAAAKHRRRLESDEGAGNTYPALVARFITEHAQKKTRRWHHTARFLGLRYPKNGDGEPQVITGGLCDRWASKPVRAIDGSDIYTIVNETQRLGVPGLKRQKDGQLTDAMARAVFAALSSFFGWCVQHRKVDKNPCTGGYRPKPPMKRDRVLSEAEIVTFWNACDALGEPTAQALRLLLLTGCRLREVSEMQRSELSADGASWTIPSSRTKNRLKHIVPLPPLARDIIASVKPIAGKAGFVFTISGKKPISIGSKVKHNLDAAMNIPAWRLHDLRRTAASGMAKLRIGPHIVEAALNHVSGVKAGVAGTYNVYAYEPEKKAALERWAAHVEGLVAG
jgi:integrase